MDVQTDRKKESLGQGTGNIVISAQLGLLVIDVQ